jgi:hypothetical protein
MLRSWTGSSQGNYFHISADFLAGLSMLRFYRIHKMTAGSVYIATGETVVYQTKRKDTIQSNLNFNAKRTKPRGSW